jgi:hypothetical protein
MNDDALLAVCRTTYRRVMAQSGASIDHVKAAARAELHRAGFEVALDDDELTDGLPTILVTLADGRCVCRSEPDRWRICRLQVP